MSSCRVLHSPHVTLNFSITLFTVINWLLLNSIVQPPHSFPYFTCTNILLWILAVGICFIYVVRIGQEIVVSEREACEEVVHRRYIDWGLQQCTPVTMCMSVNGIVSQPPFCTMCCQACLRSRRGAVVKRVEHISTIVLVNIWVGQVRVPLVLSVGIWICKNSTINA